MQVTVNTPVAVFEAEDNPYTVTVLPDTVAVPILDDTFHLLNVAEFLNVGLVSAIVQLVMLSEETFPDPPVGLY